MPPEATCDSAPGTSRRDKQAPDLVLARPRRTAGRTPPLRRPVLSERHLVAMIQGLARQIHLRGRLRQAATDLDGLAAKAEETARAPWPAKIPCPRCGAAIDRLTVDYRPEKGHVCSSTCTRTGQLARASHGDVVAQPPNPSRPLLLAEAG